MSELTNKRLMEQVEAFNEKATAATRKFAIQVEVTKSQMLTVLRKGGKSAYAKHGFLGGEKLEFSRVYYGKKNTPIVVFTPAVASTDYTSVEIPASKISDFTDFVDEYLPFVNDLGFLSFEDMWSHFYTEAMEEVKEEIIAGGVDDYGARWGSFA